LKISSSMGSRAISLKVYLCEILRALRGYCFPRRQISQFAL
jgi:hypothetical protein